MRGFRTNLRGRDVPRFYRAVLDRAQVYSGEQSLRLEYVAPSPSDSPTPAKAAQSAREILGHMESTRLSYLKKAGAAEVDWAIQNARIVHQSYEWNADETKLSREVSMARNIKWILDRAPQGAKIILWAHNGHVGRDPDALGARLTEMYGKQMVVLAFTTSAGQYNAEGKTGIETFPLTAPPRAVSRSIFRAQGCHASFSTCA